jgi:hypothetical protein
MPRCAYNLSCHWPNGWFAMNVTRPDPFTLPEWNALHREASLVSQLIGAGTTALGRANYAKGFGEYYTAFFGLSIGIERLAKLILIADFVLENDGALPNQSVVRKYGHKLKMLLEKVEGVATKHGLAQRCIMPTDQISWNAMKCLDAFADASKGRYANFEAIGNPHFNAAEEPVNKWWTEVVEHILTKHYRGTSREAGVRGGAATIEALVGDISFVQFSTELGGQMKNIATSSERTGQTKWAQKYGRFYTLKVVRWLAIVFTEMTQKKENELGFEALFGHQEFFQSYRLDDKVLLTRKNWPLI